MKQRTKTRKRGALKRGGRGGLSMARWKRGVYRDLGNVTPASHRTAKKRRV